MNPQDYSQISNQRLEKSVGRSSNNRLIGVATYEIVASLPEAYRSELPSPEEIADGLRPTGGHRLRLWDGNVDDE
jgi:hypothetical protein